MVPTLISKCPNVIAFLVRHEKPSAKVYLLGLWGKVIKRGRKGMKLYARQERLVLAWLQGEANGCIGVDHSKIGI